MKTLENKGFFQCEIIINVLVSSLQFICIPMLWVHGLDNYFNSYSAGIVFSRQNLTSTDVRGRMSYYTYIIHTIWRNISFTIIIIKKKQWNMCSIKYGKLVSFYTRHVKENQLHI